MRVFGPPPWVALGQLDPAFAQRTAATGNQGTLYVVTVLLVAALGVVGTLWLLDQRKSAAALRARTDEVKARDAEIADLKRAEKDVGEAYLRALGELKDAQLAQASEAHAAAIAREDAVRATHGAEVAALRAEGVRHAELAADAIRSAEELARLMKSAIDQMGRLADRLRGARTGE